MSIAEKLQASKDALDALLTYANDATNAGDTDIGEAIRTLVDGYGQGGGGIKVLCDGEVVISSDTYYFRMPYEDDAPTGSIAFAIYDVGDSLEIASSGYTVSHVYAYYDKDLYTWVDNTTLAAFEPVINRWYKKDDGTDITKDVNWVSGVGGSYITNTGTVNSMTYGTLRYYYINRYRDSGYFEYNRSNSAFKFVQGHTYRYKVLEIDTNYQPPTEISVDMNGASYAMNVQNCTFTGLDSITIRGSGSRAELQYFPTYTTSKDRVLNIQYENYTKIYSATTNASDVLRQVNNLGVVDFGGVSCPTTLTRFLQQWELYNNNPIPHTTFVKGLDFTGVTSMPNFCATPMNISVAERNGIYLDIEWNGVIEADIVFGSATTPTAEAVPNFTRRSLLELFDHLSTEKAGTLTLGNRLLAKLSDAEKAIATNKGWTLI